MNNSLSRLYEGMAASLSERILPHIADDFARGQAYGIVYLLRCLGQRTDWSEAYLQPQWQALEATTTRLRQALAGVAGAPGSPSGEAGTLHERCEALRAGLCATYDWAERNAEQLPPQALEAARAAWRDFIEADLKQELRLRVPLPYSEMSTGHPAATAADTVKAPA